MGSKGALRDVAENKIYGGAKSFLKPRREPSRTVWEN